MKKNRVKEEKGEGKMGKYEEMDRQLKQWRQKKGKATLTEIEEAIDRELSKVRRAMIEEMIQEGMKEPEGYTCPECGQPMVKNGSKERKLRSKEGEEIKLTRQQMRCLNCEMTLFPPG